MPPEVLIVDDNDGVLFLHELMVEESGLSDRIKTFTGAEAAIAYLKGRSGQDPVTIFLDINMPGLDGWGFMDQISQGESYSHLNVVLVTSSVNQSDKIKAEKYHQIVSFIEKPLSLEDCLKFKER